MRRIAFPIGLKQGQRLVNRYQEWFDGAMNIDDPKTDLSDRELVELINCVAYPKYLEGRRGNRLISGFSVPNLVYDSQYIYFTAEKVGDQVTITDNGNLDISDLVEGDYLIWPDGLHDQITEISGSSFTSPISGDKVLVTTAKARKPVWGAAYHDRKERVIIHIGTKLYNTDVDLANYNEIFPLGDANSLLPNSRSVLRVEDNDLIIFTTNGLFRVVFDSSNSSVAYYYPMNNDVPTARITEIPIADNKPYFRRGLYTMSRILGDNAYRNRLATDTNIQQESGPVKRDQNTQFDHSDLYSEKKIGYGSETNGVLESSIASPIPTQLSLWNWGDAAFAININGIGIQDVITDLADPESLADIADRIQGKLRVHFPGATCYYKISSGIPQLVITSGEKDGGTVTYVSSPSSGTDITSGDKDLLKMETGVGALDNSARYTDSITWEGMRIPSDGQHWSHFSLWGGRDGSPAGIALDNLPDRLTYVNDVPLIRVWKAKRLSNGKVTIDSTLSDIYFYREEENQILRWEDDYEEQIFNIIDAGNNRLYGESATNIQGDSTHALSSAMACGIGCGKVGTAEITTPGIVDLIGGNSQFFPSDVGKMLFWEDGTIFHIRVYLSSTQVGVVEAGETKVAQALGWDTLYAGKTTNVTITGSACARNSGDSFASDDIGKYLYNVDTRLVRISAFTDSDNVTLESAPGDQTIDATYGASITRSFTDIIGDDVLLARGARGDDQYLLQTRYFEPLPNSNIGEIIPAFIVVGEENKIHYSEIPPGRKFIGGYYKISDQMDDNMDDTITLLKRYPDRLVAFGKKSTWATNTTVINSLDEPLIGERIFILPFLSKVDNVGLVHTGSIQDIDIGISVLITHEPAIRAFNGIQYEDINIAENRLMKYIRNLDRFVTSAYDGVGGYRIFGTLKNQTDEFNKINPETGICLRLAVKSDQGNLWARFLGADMVWPEPNTMGLLIEDSYGNDIAVMLDERTGKWFDISPYDGPEDSGLEISFEDKDGAEIVGGIYLPEHKGDLESYGIEHLESHIYLRFHPSLSAYRTNFKVDAQIFVDGNSTKNAETKNIPLNGDVVYDRQSKGNRLQMYYILATSGWRVVALDNYYVTRDKAGATNISSRTQTETAQQKEYNNHIMWLSRGPRPTLNRAIGNLATGSYDSLVAGMDGRSDSAMKFNGTTDKLETPARASMTGDFTIQFGFKF